MWAHTFSHISYKLVEHTHWAASPFGGGLSAAEGRKEEKERKLLGSRSLQASKQASKREKEREGESLSPRTSRTRKGFNRFSAGFQGRRSSKIEIDFKLRNEKTGLKSISTCC